MHPIWLIPALLVAAPILVNLYWRRRKQTRALLQLARRKGLTFSSLDLIGLHERYYNLDLIRQGHNRHAWSVLYGSIDAGLVAVFRYSYDLGFGVNQVSHRWWIAILECPKPLANWKATPAQEAHDLQSDRTAQAGLFTIRADRAETLEWLATPDRAAALANMPDRWRMEAQGTLLAIAAPYDDSTTTPERLIEATAQLAKLLRIDETTLEQPCAAQE